MLEGQNGKFM